MFAKAHAAKSANNFQTGAWANKAHGSSGKGGVEISSRRAATLWSQLAQQSVSTRG